MPDKTPAKSPQAPKRPRGRPRKQPAKDAPKPTSSKGIAEDGGHVAPPSPGVLKSAQSPGEKCATPRKYTKTNKVSRLARDRESIIRRQRADCKRLADAIKEAADLADKGAGSSGLAAAVGQLARATATLHDLEAASYGLQDTNRAVIAVIHVPARSETIEDWAAGQRTRVQQVSGPAFDQDHANASARWTQEDDVIGAPADEDGPAAPQDDADAEGQP